MEIKIYMPDFFKMSEKEIIILSAEIAVLFTDKLTVEQQNTFGNFLMSVGQLIIMGAEQKAICENSRIKKTGCFVFWIYMMFNSTISGNGGRKMPLPARIRVPHKQRPTECPAAEQPARRQSIRWGDSFDSEHEA